MKNFMFIVIIIINNASFLALAAMIFWSELGTFNLCM